ncbi:MAG: extracellular solute-binding protein [Bdellovibrionota bacterium]
MRKILVYASLALSICTSSSAFATDQITILSPHRRSIQEEFVPKFKEYYKNKFKTDVTVSWLDQGGTSDDIRFLKAKYAKDPKSSGIDIFWGGGLSTFIELNKEKYLAKYSISPTLQKHIPATLAGIQLHDASQSWYASAMSSFGIFYNKMILKIEGIPEPKTWKDLANIKYLDNISTADPRRSGSATTMDNIILQSLGWEKGWELLTAIAGNTKKFTHSSSDPIKSVVSGDTACAMAIDFYANAKIGDLGPKNLGFSLPPSQTVIDPDPVAILKGAPNRKTAERFVEYVLSAEAQKLLILPKGQKDGPKLAVLGRMAINDKAYNDTEGRRTSDINPFKMKPALQYDVEKAAKLHRILGDLIGALHIDTHRELKAAWKAMIKRKSHEKDLAEFGKMPVSEKEALALAEKWDDNVFRNKTINNWYDFAKSKYSAIEKGK